MVTMVIYTERREVTRQTVEISQEEHDRIIRRINSTDFHNHETVLVEESLKLLDRPDVRVTDCDMLEPLISGLYDPVSDINYFD